MWQKHQGCDKYSQDRADDIVSYFESTAQPERAEQTKQRNDGLVLRQHG
jgi:hypothetical protein